MIKKIQIENFKCFLNTTVEFNNLTVLAGANGAGKSSIIQVLLLIRQLYKGSDSKLTVIPINNKIDSFLELGSTQEILASESESLGIKFTMWDSSEQYEVLSMIIDKNNPLSLT